MEEEGRTQEEEVEGVKVRYGVGSSLNCDHVLLPEQSGLRVNLLSKILRSYGGASESEQFSFPGFAACSDNPLTTVGLRKRKRKGKKKTHKRRRVLCKSPARLSK